MREIGKTALALSVVEIGMYCLPLACCFCKAQILFHILLLPILFLFTFPLFCFPVNKTHKPHPCAVLIIFPYPAHPFSSSPLLFSSSGAPISLISCIFFRVTKNSMLVTPAPTAASVIARSGDSNRIQIMHITRL